MLELAGSGSMRGLQQHGAAAPPDMAGLQVGGRAYLQNFRKGLRHRRGRAAGELREAQRTYMATRTAAQAVELHQAQRRVDWVRSKQADLVVRGLMVRDVPHWVVGAWQACGGDGDRPGYRMEPGDGRAGGGGRGPREPPKGHGYFREPALSRRAGAARLAMERGQRASGCISDWGATAARSCSATAR